MEEISQAIKRAKAEGSGASGRHEYRAGSPTRVDAKSARLAVSDQRARDSRFYASQEFELDADYLQSKRIIAHDVADGRSVAFDMLRTQVLQSMDAKEWRFIGITSPTPGCGKTMTAVNLALSVARLPERSVLLMDLDLRKPQVANTLGLRPRCGVVSTLERRSSLSEALVHARIGEYPMMVLPTESSAASASDRMASNAMRSLLQEIGENYRPQIKIVDLPPVLSSDDVLAILPQLDCVLLVAAAGATTVAQINESSKHLHSTEIVRVVLNKLPHSNPNYYYNKDGKQTS